MKKLFFGILFFSVLGCNAQLLINIQTPPAGLARKSQLWNLIAINTNNSSIRLHIEVVLNDIASGQQVMSGVTQPITLVPGTTQINAALISPIQYNILSNSYVVDASPDGLLPIGDFEICYSFLKHESDYLEKIAEECQELFVEPLGPPLLLFPFDQAAIEEVNPQFTWLPPVPSYLFTNLVYDFNIVEISTGQTPTEAIQQNFSLYSQQNIPTTTLWYPQSAPSLELNKNYAWQIKVKSNESVVTQSEIWQFTIKHFQKGSLSSGEQPYAKLRKQGEAGYSIFSGELKFDYFNETTDSTWKIAVYDLSIEERKPIVLNMDSIPLQVGQNLVRYSVEEHPNFIDKHMYILQVINSRNELWSLRFEYRQSQKNNQ